MTNTNKENTMTNATQTDTAARAKAQAAVDEAHELWRTAAQITSDAQRREAAVLELCHARAKVLTDLEAAAPKNTDAQLLATFLAATDDAYLARVALSRLQLPAVGPEKCAALTAAYTVYGETRDTARAAEQAYKNR